MQRARQVRGYHGTSTSKARQILQGTFQPSRNPYDWLGDGVYFWEEAPGRALEWARQNYADDAAVIEADLLLDGCMDLAERFWQDFLRDIHRSFARERRRSGRPLPRQRPNSGPHPLDRIIINRTVSALRNQGIEIRAVRSIFREGRRLYPWSAFHSHDHVQIAVRDTRLILAKRIYLH